VVERAVGEGVVQQGPSRLGGGRGHPGDLHDRHVFGEAAGHAVDRTEFADAEGGDDGADSPPDAGVSVSGVGGIQLVGRADPLDALDGQHLVEQAQVEVAGQPEEVRGTQLRESGREVCTDADAGGGGIGHAHQ
jgi:hypothetical protein